VDKQAQWKSFLKRNELNAMELTQVVRTLNEWLLPVLLLARQS
jgi:hypothetical protein